MRAPITPDKVEAIYLPSVGDAITRLRPSSTEGEDGEKNEAKNGDGDNDGGGEKRVGGRRIYELYTQPEGEQHTFGRK